MRISFLKEKKIYFQSLFFKKEEKLLGNFAHIIFSDYLVMHIDYSTTQIILI